MTRQRAWGPAFAAAALAFIGLAAPVPAAAHCDSLDGPVVRAAREALSRGDVTPALRWVGPTDEAAIRQAFERTMQVRSASAEARELADLWFFETLVRIHRAGEGEPYTGLKPAGSEPPAGISAADEALDEGDGGRLIRGLSEAAARELRDRYDRVRRLREFDPDDVEAGRRYVRAYVDYIHFVERLHGLLNAEGGAHDLHASHGG